MSDICPGCYDSHCRHSDWCDEIRIDTRKTDRSVMMSAPDLLAALKECADLLDDYQDVLDGDDGPRPNRAMSLLQRVEAVIAKAEGK